MRWGRLSAGSRASMKRQRTRQAAIPVVHHRRGDVVDAGAGGGRVGGVGGAAFECDALPTVPRDGRIVVDVHRVGVVGGDRRGGSGRDRGWVAGTGALHGEWWVGGVTRGEGAATLHHGTGRRGVGGESIDPRRKYLGASRVRVPPLRTRAGRWTRSDFRGRKNRSSRVVDRRRPGRQRPAAAPGPARGVVVRRARPGHSDRRSRDLAHPRGTGPSRRFANRRVLIGFARKVSPIENTRARSK